MNPHAARPIRSLAILALAASMAACATVDPNAPPEVPAGAVESTRTESNGDVVTEYRVNGALSMVRISPKQGPVYYLVDADHDGRLDRTAHGSRDTPVYFKLYEW
jgi:hypothetical protein